MLSVAAPVGLNLGKKMSVPKDIMMEELNLSANRGSRMFQQRQKRAERFTLENAANGVDNASNVRNREGNARQVPIGATIVLSQALCCLHALPTPCGSFLKVCWVPTGLAGF